MLWHMITKLFGSTTRNKNAFPSVYRKTLCINGWLKTPKRNQNYRQQFILNIG